MTIESTTNTSEPERSVLASLRAVIPLRPANFTESLIIAEQQAARLLSRFGIRQWPVPETILLELPRITVEQRLDMPTSGCSFWDSATRTWVIQVNGAEPVTRQRFTLLHEYKHIVDHGRVELLYGTGPEARVLAEKAADYFAGCALVPRSLLKRAWGDRIQRVADLAANFEVSQQAVSVRLAQIGILDPAPRSGVRHDPSWSRSLRTQLYQRFTHPDYLHLEAAAA